MDQTRHEHYSTLEVDGAHSIPIPVPNTNPPEAINVAGKEVAFQSRIQIAREKTSSGARRKSRWIWIAIASILLIGIAIGVGVGVTRKRPKEPDDSGAPEPATDPRGVSSTSRLAAANYTDPQGAEHSQVYYQDNALDIWMADWNGSSGSWTNSPILAKDNSSAIQPKNGTPIAAYNWFSIYNTGTNRTSSDFRCVFIDNSDIIRAFGALNQSTSEWHTLAILDEVLATSENSSLVGYTPPCGNDTCDASDFLAFESSKGNLWMEYPLRGGSSGQFLPGGVKTDPATAMAVIPIHARVNATTDARKTQLTMYLVHEGTLMELTGSRGKAWYSTAAELNDKKFVDAGAQLAAMSRVTDGLISIEVLVTRSDGGVAMAYYDENQKHWYVAERIEGTENVLPLSPIAATQAGRVYAFENASRVVEWKLVAGKHPPEFERVGVVDTKS